MNVFLPPLRPPGAAQEEAFLKLCIRCGKCVEICPYQSLRLQRGFGHGRKTPLVDPAQTPCYLCMKCPPVCPTGALNPGIANMADANMGRAYILKSLCHNYTDLTMCMTCYDRCPMRGQAVILVNGLVPAITENCVGCGVCAYVCPQKAIEIVAASSSYVPDQAAPMEKSRF